MKKYYIFLFVYITILCGANSSEDSFSNEWRKTAHVVASSYRMTYEDFIKKADLFLAKYKEEHPYQNYPNSIEDLAIVKKPDCSELIAILSKQNESLPAEEQFDISLFTTTTPQFLVPLRS